MLYDLNIPWTASTPPADVERTLRFAKTLGYDVVALNQLIQGPVPKTVTNPIPLLTPPHPSYPQQQGSSSGHVAAATRTAASSSATPPPSSSAGLPTVLRRATIVISDPIAANYKLAEHARVFDLLAVRPTTVAALTWACVTQDSAWVISLDLATHLDFYFAPKTCMAAVARGVRFEIAYGQAVGAGTTAQQRASFLSNVLGLLRATKGRGVLVSSEARSALGLRAPADVVNLLAVWGLGTEKGLEALGGVPRGVVVNEGIRRRGFRGIIDVVETAKKEAIAEDENVEMEDADNGASGQGKRNKGKGKDGGKVSKQHDQQTSKQKRKGRESNPAGEDNEGAAGVTQPTSKRQAKKMRKAETASGL